jgi:ribosomal protein L16 Arg81 hydroxylase
LQGRKRWLLYPPDVDPPGVPVDDDTDDGVDYDAPEPIKYLVEEYLHVPKERRALEIIMGAGDIIYVPSGWWHMVLNLEVCLLCVMLWVCV